MKLYLRNEVRESGLDTRRLRRNISTLLDALDQTDASISLSLVDDAEIARINGEHRGKDAPTDVLSFPMDPDDGFEAEEGGVERMLGDIVVSVETARVQANDYDASLENEVDRLIIHGLLHLLGHDHMEPEERSIMQAEERRLAASIGMEWPYRDGEQ